MLKRKGRYENIHLTYSNYCRVYTYSCLLDFFLGGKGSSLVSAVFLILLDFFLGGISKGGSDTSMLGTSRSSSRLGTSRLGSNAEEGLNCFFNSAGPGSVKLSNGGIEFSSGSVKLSNGGIEFSSNGSSKFKGGFAGGSGSVKLSNGGIEFSSNGSSKFKGGFSGPSGIEGDPTSTLNDTLGESWRILDAKGSAKMRNRIQ